MQGNPALTHTTNVIFRRDGFEALHDKKPGYRFVFLKPEGTWATLVAINGRDQWRFSIVRSGDGSRALTEEEIRACIVDAVGIEFEYDILSVMPWTRRQLVAEQYRSSRVFIAGDAAHMMSPTGGFGMNTGVGDIVDLAWKIEAVLQGWGGKALLDSYEAERRPVGLRNVAEEWQSRSHAVGGRFPAIARRHGRRRQSAPAGRHPHFRGDETRMAVAWHPSRLCLCRLSDLHPGRHAAAE
jgi:2-polyprenyl-6-methoxyphenol hydroxylase-like FAD-dependent oxidoreductase